MKTHTPTKKTYEHKYTKSLYCIGQLHLNTICVLVCDCYTKFHSPSKENLYIASMLYMGFCTCFSYILQMFST